MSGTLPQRVGANVDLGNYGPGSTEYGRMVDRPGLGRPLLAPYSLSSKVLQLPWKLLWRRNWYTRFIFYGWLAGLPLIWSIHKMANSPANVEKWTKIRQQWRDEAMGKARH